MELKEVQDVLTLTCGNSLERSVKFFSVDLPTVEVIEDMSLV